MAAKQVYNDKGKCTDGGQMFTTKSLSEDFATF